jgi:hypothetical protein
MTLLPESGKELKSQLLTGYTACNRGRSYQSGIFSAPIWGIQFYSLLLRFFWKTNGSTCTIVSTRPFPDWCGNFMATLSSSRVMTEDRSCRLWSEAKQLNLWCPFVFHSTLMVIIITLFTLCHCVTKMGSIFWFILVCRPGMYFQTGQVFLSQNGQRGSLLIFYIGYIL